MVGNRRKYAFNVDAPPYAAEVFRHMQRRCSVAGSGSVPLQAEEVLRRLPLVWRKFSECVTCAYCLNHDFYKIKKISRINKRNILNYDL